MSNLKDQEKMKRGAWRNARGKNQGLIKPALDSNVLREGKRFTSESENLPSKGENLLGRKERKKRFVVSAV